ncbi:MAG: hypothetical protein Q4F70_02665 [Clostridia bacterium]|nr:hypothetical protein [Clostridia bacterium]
MTMLLVKKQLREVADFYIKDRKTGKRQTKGKMFLFIALWVFVFLSLGAAGFGLCDLFGSVFFEIGLDWFFFALMGLVAVFVGIFGSVFNTYATLYKAKDNETLLSLPIDPKKILIARLTTTYILGLFFSALFYLPTIIYYYTHVTQTVASVVCSFFQFFILDIATTALVCIIGYFVALLSSRFSGKTFITVIVTMGFLVLYYWGYFKLMSSIETIAGNGAMFAQKLEGRAYLLHKFGESFTGDIPAFLVCTLIAVALFAIVFFVLSSNYLKIMTTNRGAAKTEYVAEKSIKTGSLKSALLMKEWKRFTKSAVYLMNSGIGAIVAPVIVVAAIIKADAIRAGIDKFAEIIPNFDSYLPLIPMLAILMIGTMTGITTPSISLEGQSIWILKSLPVDPREVMASKRRLHLLVGIPVVVIVAVAFGFVLKLSVPNVATTILIGIAYTLFNANAGLTLNLLMPNLTWKDETIPVKQSMPALIIIFGSFALFVALGALYIKVLRDMIPDPLDYMNYVFVFFVVCAGLLQKWIDTKGVEIWNEL